MTAAPDAVPTPGGLSAPDMGEAELSSYSHWCHTCSAWCDHTADWHLPSPSPAPRGETGLSEVRSLIVDAVASRLGGHDRSEALVADLLARARETAGEQIAQAIDEQAARWKAHVGERAVGRYEAFERAAHIARTTQEPTP